MVLDLGPITEIVNIAFAVLELVLANLSGIIGFLALVITLWGIDKLSNGVIGGFFSTLVKRM